MCNRDVMFVSVFTFLNSDKLFGQPIFSRGESFRSWKLWLMILLDTFTLRYKNLIEMENKNILNVSTVCNSYPLYISFRFLDFSKTTHNKFVLFI